MVRVLPSVSQVQLVLETPQRERGQVEVYLLQVRGTVKVGQQVVSLQRGRLLWEVVDVQVEVVHAKRGPDRVFDSVLNLFQPTGEEAVDALEL